MKKNIYLIIIYFIIPITLISQESKLDNRNYLGLNFSNNLCNQIEKIDDLYTSVELPDGSLSTYEIDYNYRYGYRIGLDYNLSINSRISFSLETNYNQINLEKNIQMLSYRIVDNYGVVSTIDGYLANQRDRYNYISLYQSFKYKLIYNQSFNVFASVGVTEDLIINSNHKIFDKSLSKSEPKTELNVEFKDRKLSEKFSLGFISKIGFEKSINGILFGFAFNYYYNSILRFDSIDNYHQFSGGIEIGIKKYIN